MSDHPAYRCARCGYRVWERDALCRDCRSVTYDLGEVDRWITSAK